ncbi:hypothetical protein [Kineococcus glutinatus]|uniref:Uncharacterized protein n=1 Tax=Kineococcus glutinatus TaxID=1070872 RepID=A0ABP9HRG3_9ACTN
MTAASSPDGAPRRPPAAAAGRAPAARSRRGDEGLADDELAAEIELYTDVVLAASESDGPLRAPELDRLLGVQEPAEGA